MGNIIIIGHILVPYGTRTKASSRKGATAGPELPALNSMHSHIYFSYRFLQLKNIMSQKYGTLFLMKIRN
jgi:hypothetical protein